MDNLFCVTILKLGINELISSALKKPFLPLRNQAKNREAEIPASLFFRQLRLLSRNSILVHC
ncbi:hypothetical protein, partial [Grimontia marina]|uniref:hypothetical protein n=1 Tax=Grimontia marina TaxID=646534 RepID=UPI001E51695B